MYGKQGRRRRRRKKTSDLDKNPTTPPPPTKMVGPNPANTSGSSDDGQRQVLYHAGVNAANGAALQYVMDNSDPGPMTDLVKFFCEGRTNMLIRPIYRQTLSPWQRENFLQVTKQGQWEKEPFAQVFAAEVERYRFISFDLEARRDEELNRDRVVLAHMGTASGKGVLFDLELMASGRYAPEEDALRDVPQAFKYWLRSPDIYTAGSDIRRDEQKTGINIKRMVDMRDVFAYYRELKYEGKPIIDIGKTSKTGLGIKAFYSKGVDFKPMARHKHVALYGDPGYKTQRGARMWPDFKHWTIYKWKRDDTGHITQPAIFYNFHDCCQPQSTIGTIFLDMAAGPGIVVGGSCSVADAIHAVIQPVLDRRPVPQVIRDLGFPSPTPGTSQEASKVATPQAKAQVQQDQGRAPPAKRPADRTVTLQEPISVSSSAASTEGSDTLSLAAHEDLSEGEIVDDDEGAKAKPELKEPPNKKLRHADYRIPGMPAYTVRWDWEVDRKNPYARYPAWGKHCEACGLGKHAIKDKAGNIMCPSVKDQEWLICGYRRCSKEGHTTKVCKALHQICPLCLHRGHDRYAGCARWNKLQWTVAKHDFEDAASQGMYTTSRHHDERWGWWAAKSGTPFPYPLAYKDLLQLQVEDADKALAAQRPGVAVSAGGPTPPTPAQGPGGAVGRPVMARLGQPPRSVEPIPARPSAASSTDRRRSGDTPASGTRSQSRSQSASAAPPASGSRGRSRRRSPDVKFLGKVKGFSRGRK